MIIMHTQCVTTAVSSNLVSVLRMYMYSTLEAAVSPYQSEDLQRWLLPEYRQDKPTGMLPEHLHSDLHQPLW